MTAIRQFISSFYEAAGVFKALLNFVMPIAQVVTSISILILPVLVSLRQTNRFQQVYLFCVVGVSSACVVYWGLIWMFGARLVELFYAGQYLEYAPLLALVGAIPLFSSLVTLTARALQAKELPNKVFIADCIATVVTLPIGAVLLHYYSFTGIFITFILTSCTALFFIGRVLFLEIY